MHAVLVACAMMVGQVGAMMGGSELGGSAPGGGFAITTEGNSPLATESSSIIVTEAHP